MNTPPSGALPGPDQAQQQLLAAFLPAPSTPEVLRQQVRMCYGNLVWALPVNVGVTLCVASRLTAPGRGGWVWAWLALALAVVALRFADHQAYRTRPGGDLELPRWRRHAILGAGCQGLIWGLAGTLLMPVAPMDQVFLVAVLAGMVAGAVVHLSPIWPAYLAFLIPANFFVGLRILAGGMEGQRLLGVLSILYGLAMVLVSAKTCRWLEDSLRATADKEALSATLKAANADLEDYREHLELIVHVRTGELSQANLDIQNEMKAKEEQRREAEASQDRYQKLFESMGEGFCHLDMEHRFRLVNPAGERIFGVAPGSLTGRSLDEFLSPGNREQMPPAPGPGDPGEAATYVHEIIRDSGEVRWLQVKASPVADAQGQPTGASVVFRDITELHFAEKALRRSEERNRAILAAMPDLLYLNHRDGRFLGLHAHDHEALPASAGVMLAGSVEEVLPAPLAQQFMTAFQDALRDREVQAFTYTTGSPEGARHFEARVARCDEDTLITLVRDITEQRSSEEAARQTQKQESLSVLAGGIAHDFNNLLGAILGNLNLAQLELGPQAKAQAYLTAMEAAVGRASELARKMLAYSGKGKFQVAEVDLNQLMADLPALLDLEPKGRATLHLDLAGHLPTVLADPAQVQQIILNLVTNAAEAMEGREGPIEVSTKVVVVDAEAARAHRLLSVAPGLHVRVRVRDTGTGIAPEALSRIFDPFFTTKESGRGLGLSAMLGVLRSHGAGITIASEPGKGSTFSLYFPVGARTPSLATPARGQRRAPQRRVLLVDDEPALLETGQVMLERLGYQVLTARDGVEAIALFREQPHEIALVLLDLTMPRMDGHQTFQALRALAPDLPVIITSGYDPQQSVHLLHGPGAPAFLQKPFSFKQLSKALALALTAGEASLPN